MFWHIFVVSNMCQFGFGSSQNDWMQDLQHIERTWSSAVMRLECLESICARAYRHIIDTFKEELRHQFTLASAWGSCFGAVRIRSSRINMNQQLAIRHSPNLWRFNLFWSRIAINEGFLVYDIIWYVVMWYQPIEVSEKRGTPSHPF